MRRLIFMLLLSLLSLQAWTGVAMTTHMAAAKVATHLLADGQLASNVALGIEVSAGMPADCALRMGLTADAGASNAKQSCNDCHACHTIAVTEPAQIHGSMAFSAPFARAVPPYFVSAEAQRSQKPPIFFA